MDDYITDTGSTGEYKFLHDGTGGFIMAAVQYGSNPNPNTTLAVAGNGGGGSSTTGFQLYYDDAAPENDAHRTLITASGGNVPINSTGANGTLPAATPLTHAFSYSVGDSPYDYRYWINGVETGGKNDSVNPATGSASTSLYVGCGASAVRGSYLEGRIYALVIFDRDWETPLIQYL